MFKHVAKQRRLINANKQVQLSDEESSGNSASEDDHDDRSDFSGDEESGSEGEDEDSEEDEVAEEDEEEASASEDELELLPPPPGFPTALEALDNPIATAAAPTAEEEAVAPTEDVTLVCVVCPSKVLKHGKMLEVHLGSKDHTRRLSRFKAHITSPDFPSTSQTVDARLIAAQLDSLVFARLSAQTTSGASSSSKLPSNPTPAKPITKEAALSAAQAKTAALKLAAEQEGISKRQALREAKAKKNKAKREARKEKGERIKRRKEKAGEVVEEKPKSKKPRYVAPIPTKDEIAQRQALKQAKREAAALVATGTTVPKDEVALKKEAEVATPVKKAGEKRVREEKKPRSTSKKNGTPKAVKA